MERRDGGGQADTNTEKTLEQMNEPSITIQAQTTTGRKESEEEQPALTSQAIQDNKMNWSPIKIAGQKRTLEDLEEGEVDTDAKGSEGEYDEEEEEEMENSKSDEEKSEAGA